MFGDQALHVTFLTDLNVRVLRFLAVTRHVLSRIFLRQTQIEETNICVSDVSDSNKDTTDEFAVRLDFGEIVAQASEPHNAPFVQSAPTKQHRSYVHVNVKISVVLKVAVGSAQKPRTR